MDLTLTCVALMMIQIKHGNTCLRQLYLLCLQIYVLFFKKKSIRESLLYIFHMFACMVYHAGISS